MEPAAEIAERGYLVPPVVQQKWAAARPSCNPAGFAESFLPRGRAPEVGELFRFPPPRARCAPSAPRGQGLLRRRDRRAVTVRAAARRLPEHGRPGAHEAQWVSRWPRTTAATRCTRSRRTAGHRRADRAGHPVHFDLASLPVDGVASQHLQIEAMKLAFADVYRYVADADMEVTPAQMLDDAYLASRAS
jgi:gamma-glutamyltranspeptidase/glutathione hydrolase